MLAVGFLMTADQPKDDATKKDLAKMQGDWAAVSAVFDGRRLSDDEAQSIFRTVKDDQYTIFLFDKTLDKGTFKIDATKKPKTIDAVPASGPGKGKPLLGIYEFEGDNLKISFASPRKDRPKGFTAKEGSGQTLIVWEREKK